jgi:hypothetical protein
VTLRVLGLSVAALVGAARPAPGQAPMNPNLGLLMGGFRVQLRAEGVDSMIWFTGRITQTREGCTWVEIENGRWMGGMLVPDSGVPPRERLLAPLHRVRRVSRGTDPGTPVDEVDVRLLLSGEPPGCRPRRRAG